MVDLRVELLPKQLSFIRSTATEVGYSGAYGAGKSRALCYKLVARAAIPGAREGLARKHLVALRATTLKTLLEDDGDKPAVLPAGCYQHNQTRKTIRLRGGGEIQYFGLDDEKKIGSYNLSGVAIDEAVELAEKDYLQLEGRLRVDAPGIVRQLYWAGNPGPPTHFLARRFGLALGEELRDGAEIIETNTFENSFLTDDYLERMRRKVGVDYQRNVLGKWVGSDGLVYDGFDRQVHVRERDAGEFRRWFLAVDDGYRNPFACLLVGEDGDGRLHVFDETYRTGLAIRQKVDAATRLATFARESEAKYAGAVVDPAAAQLIREFGEAGLDPASKVPKDVFDGIQAVGQALVDPGDGLPRLTISPRAVATGREFETYEWRNRDGAWIDEPVKEHDHALDALRYLVLYLRRPQPRFRS